MANAETKERNKAVKGRTGFLTVAKRKRRGLKAKPWGKATPPGVRPSPTDRAHGKGVASKAKPK